LLLGLVELRGRLRISLAVIDVLLLHRVAPRFVVDDLDISFRRSAGNYESPRAAEQRRRSPTVSVVFALLT
jgi:hypothetical protein